jgi:hypothetical protein
MVSSVASYRSWTRLRERLLGRRFSPLGHWERVAPSESQTALRRLFQHWGLPERVRLDNGYPWGSSADLPPALALWLVGLGIGLIYNPARTPQSNGVVERFHGLAEPWGEPERCSNLAAWQERLDWIVRVQRERYPAVDNHTRLEAFPGLLGRARPYDGDREAEQWRLELVKDYLAQGTWRRKVDKVGRISIYGRPLGVGRAYKRQDVLVTFDPQANEWVIHDPHDQVITRRAAIEIGTAAITKLDVSRHRATKHASTIDTTMLPTA